MSELDGVWDVRRTGGLLPPLMGVRLEIHGTRGETLLPLGVIGVPFDVVGLELHYRTPFVGVVDILTPRDGGFTGRATFRRITFGRFELTPIRGGALRTITEQLVKQIDEAHAMEQDVLRMLDVMISTTDDPELVQALARHKIETEGHAKRMRLRLEAHGAQPSTVRQAVGILGALAKLPLDVVRGERADRNARDGYATEHMEIATYELLRRIAQRAHDEETVTDCDLIIGQERAMAETIAMNWDTFAALSLRELGVAVT